jgi:uncharacterized protein YndB with AHSA1/START domain
MIKISFEVTDAPPRLTVTEFLSFPLASVWLARTEALYVQRWWAPADYDNVDINLTTEIGGPWRVVQRDPQGNQYAFYGRVEEVTPQERLTITITSEFFPQATTQLTQQFFERDAGTVVVSTYLFGSDEELQAYLNLGGMDRLRGASGRLDTLLSQLNA